jgi:ferrous iron transport protein A
MLTLNSLNINQEATIKEIQPSLVRRRLLELGFLPNTKLKVVHKTPFGGPISISIRGYHIALRVAEAKTIIIY